MPTREDIDNFFTKTVANRLAGDPSYAKKLNCLYQFTVGGIGTYTVDLTQGNGVVSTGVPSRTPDCHFQITQNGLATLVSNPWTALSLVTKGELKVSDIAKGMALGELLKNLRLDG